MFYSCRKILPAQHGPGDEIPETSMYPRWYLQDKFVAGYAQGSLYARLCALAC